MSNGKAEAGGVDRESARVPLAGSTTTPARDASRELDALVAEKVMGYRWRAVTGMAAFALDDPAGFPAALRYHADDELRAASRLPHVSTDDAAALLVVQQLTALGWRVEIDLDPASGPTECACVSLSRGPRSDDYTAHCASTFALAVCNAALAAMELP